MFLPIGDSPNPRNFTPWVNYTLIALNVAIYVLLTLPLSTQSIDLNDPAAQAYIENLRRSLPPGIDIRQVLPSLSAWEIFVFEHGYKPGAGQISDLFSAMFMHAGFMHLAGNMLFLWIYGDNVEHRVGRVFYLLLYLVTGVAATLVFSLFAGSSMIPLVGASGAISGVLGLYFLMFPRNQVKVFIAFFPFFLNVVLIPARWVLGFYVIAQNFLPFLFGATSGGVAYGAHLGGFFAGLGIAWLGERRGWRIAPKEPFRSKPRHGVVQGGPTTIGELEQAIMRGDREMSLRTFSTAGAPLAAALSPGACAQLAEWLLDAGAPIAANDILRRCLARHRHETGPGIARAHLVMGLVRLSNGQPTAAYQYLLQVFDLDPDPDTAMRTQAALRQIAN